ncbi:hypothetical protein [Paenibacillus sp. YIM B09110]
MIGRVAAKGDMDDAVEQQVANHIAGIIPLYARSASGDLDATVMNYKLFN